MKKITAIIAIAIVMASCTGGTTETSTPCTNCPADSTATTDTVATPVVTDTTKKADLGTVDTIKI